MSIRIMVVDDHALLRQGIRNVLELEPDFIVVAEAADGEEAIAKAAEWVPDVLLLDINMPRMNGLEVTKKISVAQPTIRIVILTMHDDENYVIEVIKAGAVGYLLKDVEPSMLVKAIRSIFEGESYIYPSLAKKLFGELSRKEEKAGPTSNPLDRPREERLTYRELEVLQLICRGMSNHVIAQNLFLSEKTVKNHLTNIFRKINVADRTQAVLYALKHKMVDLN